MGKTDKEKFSLKDRLSSFRHAFSGIEMMLRTEHNFRIHCIIFLVVVLASVLLRLTLSEWIIILLVSGLVFTAECINSSIEYLSDEISPGFSEKIKRAKDVAAAGVLIAAFTAAVTGLLIFIPALLRLIK